MLPTEKELFVDAIVVVARTVVEAAAVVVSTVAIVVPGAVVVETGIVVVFKLPALITSKVKIARSAVLDAASD